MNYQQAELCHKLGLRVELKDPTGWREPHGRFFDYYRDRVEIQSIEFRLKPLENDDDTQAS